MRQATTQRKRATEQQKRFQERLLRYREIFAASHDAIAVIAPTGEYLEQNQAHKALVGYTDEELKGKTPAIHLGEEVFQSIARALDDQGRFGGEVVSRSKSGRLLDVEISAFTVRDEAGRVLCHVGVKRDVTERKRTERALARRAREQAVLYRFTDRLHRAAAMADIYEAALDGIMDALECRRASILLFDKSGVMRFAGWRGLSERYRAAVEGHSPWQPGARDPEPICVSDIEAADLSASLKATIRTEGIRGLAFIPLVANEKLIGKFMAYHDAPHYFSSEELSLGLIIARQLAFAVEHMRAEEGNARLAAIVEHSDDAIISKDLNGVIRTWNRGAERIFGYTAAETIGLPVTILMPPGRKDEEPLILERIRRGETIDHYETVRVRKDGTLLDVSLTVSPIRNARGEIIGASKIARDITASKRAEAALRESEKRLEQAVNERTASLREAIAQMEEFSYTVSHDLRAPLRGMLTYSQALLDEYGGTIGPEGLHYLERLVANANRLDRMILDVLTFSRVARADLKLEPVSLDRLVRDLVEHDPVVQSSAAELAIEPLEDVLGHEPSLTQAISNLLNNAVKFVKPGERPRVRIWTERVDQNVRLWIQDNGIGIDPRHQHRLFNMFERIHANLPYEGTGVGLAIVRKAVERMGGKVGMTSEGVNGSRFWIQVRAAETLKAAA